MDVQKKLHPKIINKKRKQDVRKIWTNKQSITTKRKTKLKKLRKEKIVINKQSHYYNKDKTREVDELENRDEHKDTP